MKLTLHPCHLPLEHMFTISRESKAIQPSMIVELTLDGISGFGEAPDDPYYGTSLDTLATALTRAEPILADYEFGSPSELWNRLHPALSDAPFALSALDIAVNDLFARLKNQPLYANWHLSWENTPPSSYTIGIDELDVMIRKLNERPNWPVYKIKLGTNRDLEIIRELRNHTNATFRVDANCGWSAEETISNSKALAELGVEFIEQPLPRESDDSDHKRVFNESGLPIVADESCQTESDVERCHDMFHGINVKLCKCGGLTPAVRMLKKARSLDMKTMLGCMVESSVGISATAHLTPLLDYADLDGAVLIAKDPATGIRVDNGQINLTDPPGSGAQLRPDVLADLHA